MGHGDSGKYAQIPAERLDFDLLGGFRLHLGGRAVPGLEHPRLQHLLAYLALHRAAPISRQQLAFLFWPDSTEQQAFKNLRTLLTRLRLALPEVERFIEITPQTIQWRADAPFALDVAVFEAALGQATGGGPEAVNALAQAAALYTGDLLPGCYDDWILPLRERLRQACGEALERLVVLLEEQRDYAGALPHARRLLDHDPLHEAAYHHLIRLHLALGNRTEALRVCRACEAMLEREFGSTLAGMAREWWARLIETQEPPAAAVGQPPAGSAGLPLVGRGAEWPRLISAWRAAAAGQPRMVLLSGEAGIGKTRLAEELCAWVERQGAAVAAAHCYPAGGIAVAYAPVVEWLNDGDIRARMAGLGDVWLAEIARIYPALLADHPRLKSPGPLTEPWQRTRLFEALARAVLGPGERAPLLLFLDDLQWCDQETLDWLGYLLRFDAKAPVLVVSTVRKYEIDSVHPLMAFWFALTRSGLLFEIPLGPLDAAETGLLAASVAGRMVDGDETARIYQDTEGNPLFVVEMVQTERPDAQQALPAALLYPSPGAAFPPKVRAVIQWRLAQLTSPARALAQTAAVIGRRFRLEVLARASGLDEDAVAGGLEELWRRHIVRVQSSSEYDFSHDGIRAVVYDEIAPFRRRAAHLRVAQALEELHHADLDAASIPIAGHYEQAGQLQPAIRFYLRAASVAESVYANAQAARLYQHLLESELSAGLTRPEACGVMLALGEVWIATGQWAQAETTIRKALAAALALNDAPLAARAKCALADVLHLLGYYDAALRWLEEAQSAFRAAGDERGEAGALRIAGEIHWRRGDHARALAALEQQREMAVGMGDPYGMCQAQEAIGMVLWSQGDWERAADSCLKAIRTAEPLEYKPILTRASITLGNISSGEHRHAEAVAWYQRAGALARESDDRQALCWVTYYIAQILATYGDDARARAGYLRSLRSALEIGDRLSACLNVAGLAEVVERLGSAGSAESLYRLAIELGLRLNISGYLTGVLVRQARLLLGQGRAGDARDVYQQALAQMAGVAADPLAGEDTRFDAQVLGIHLRRALGECSPVESAAELRALLLRAGAQSSQAALYDALWQLAPEAEDARAAAAALYRAEYAVTWARKYRQRYEALAGEPLPNPPPLPDVSDLIPDPPENPDLEPILAQIRSSFE